VLALQEAGEAAKGATVYVNLEPCNHYGRTPPCTDALIAAEVARVVVGMVDPDPRVSGAGIARLREAGIEVTVGVDADVCEAFNEAFVHRSRHQRPFGILKYAMTLDGKIAATTGHSAWITEPETREEVHELRGECDGVIVGGNTVRQDDPHLTTHGLGRNPLRIVLSRGLDLPKEAHLWSTTEAPTLVFTQVGAPTDFQAHLHNQGVEVAVLEDLTPKAVMGQLYDRGLLSVLWECGGTLAATAMAAGAVQKVWAFIAPKIIGGQTAPSPVGDLGLVRMDQALQLERVKWEQIGSDFLLQGYLANEGIPLSQE
jgi:diaminohydroxyphosphoribosylaminopyrimidine deaminase/5-amino-6-(5-phosphoribosylamino)uracil reductase